MDSDNRPRYTRSMRFYNQVEGGELVENPMPWSDPNHDIGADLRAAAQPIEWSATLTDVSEDAMHLLFGTKDETAELKQRLNARWRDHVDPDAEHRMIVDLTDGARKSGSVRNGRMTDDGNYVFDFTPDPIKGDPAYYLRNPL